VKPGARTGAAKPSSAKKKPAEIIEEDEPKATHPTVLVLAVIALLTVLFLCYQQYTIDSTFGRVTEPTFGWPEDASAAAADDSSAAEEEEPAAEEEEEEETEDEE
jgi:hypothetical protein